MDASAARLVQGSCRWRQHLGQQSTAIKSRCLTLRLAEARYLKLVKGRSNLEQHKHTQKKRRNKRPNIPQTKKNENLQFSGIFCPPSPWPWPPWPWHAFLGSDGRKLASSVEVGDFSTSRNDQIESPSFDILKQSWLFHGHEGLKRNYASPPNHQWFLDCFSFPAQSVFLI